MQDFINRTINGGLTISTFHSLKGLEFKNVIVVCMDDAIFPNFGLIDSKRYDPTITTALKEAEVRLWYVAVTRAKENLHVFYAKDNPSLFVRYALEDNFPVAGVFQKPFEDNSVTIDIDDELNSATVSGPKRITFDGFDNRNPVIAEALSCISKADETQTTAGFADNGLADHAVNPGSELEDLDNDELEDMDDELEDMDYEPDEFVPNMEAAIDEQPRNVVSKESNIWQSTAELVAMSNVDAPLITPSSNTEDVMEETEQTDTVQLNSGKSLYLSKLINSL